jgi:hypothetical protein
MWDQEKYQKAIAFAGFAHRNQMVPGKEYTYEFSMKKRCFAAVCAVLAMNRGLDIAFPLVPQGADISGPVRPEYHLFPII